MQVMRNGETNVFTLEKVFDKIDLNFEEGATVTLTLYDEAALAITGASALSMAQVAGTTGRNTLYRAEVPHTVTLPSGTEGWGIATVTTTDAKVGKIEEVVRYVSVPSV